MDCDRIANNWLVNAQLLPTARVILRAELRPVFLGSERNVADPDRTHLFDPMSGQAVNRPELWIAASRLNERIGDDAVIDVHPSDHFLDGRGQCITMIGTEQCDARRDIV